MNKLEKELNRISLEQQILIGFIKSDYKKELEENNIIDLFYYNNELIVIKELSKEDIIKFYEKVSYNKNEVCSMKYMDTVKLVNSLNKDYKLENSLYNIIEYKSFGQQIIQVSTIEGIEELTNRLVKGVK